MPTESLEHGARVKTCDSYCNPKTLETESLELQVVADSKAGGELELALPLPGVRLARCYLPWVSLAMTQVPL